MAKRGAAKRPVIEPRGKALAIATSPANQQQQQQQQQQLQAAGGPPPLERPNGSAPSAAEAAALQARREAHDRILHCNQLLLLAHLTAAPYTSERQLPLVLEYERLRKDALQSGVARSLDRRTLDGLFVALTQLHKRKADGLMERVLLQIMQSLSWMARRGYASQEEVLVRLVRWVGTLTPANFGEDGWKCIFALLMQLKGAFLPARKELVEALFLLLSSAGQTLTADEASCVQRSKALLSTLTTRVFSSAKASLILTAHSLHVFWLGWDLRRKQPGVLPRQPTAPTALDAVMEAIKSRSSVVRLTNHGHLALMISGKQTTIPHAMRSRPLEPGQPLVQPRMIQYFLAERCPIAELRSVCEKTAGAQQDPSDIVSAIRMRFEDILDSHFPPVSAAWYSELQVLADQVRQAALGDCLLWASVSGVRTHARTICGSVPKTACGADAEPVAPAQGLQAAP